MISHARLQLGALAALRKQVAGASSNDLLSIRGEVAASVAAVQASAQQASQSSGALTASLALKQASDAARKSVDGFMHDFYEQREFDPYLKFASAKDEEEYKRREEERHREIEKALAENTPAGNARAADIAIQQLKDAGAHGADKSPDYAPTLSGLESRRDALTHELERSKPDAAKVNNLEEGPLLAIPSDVLASIRNAKITGADASSEGHAYPLVFLRVSNISAVKGQRSRST